MSLHNTAWIAIGLAAGALTCLSVVQMMLTVTGDAASLATLTVFAMLVGTLNDPIDVAPAQQGPYEHGPGGEFRDRI